MWTTNGLQMSPTDTWKCILVTIMLWLDVSSCNPECGLQGNSSYVDTKPNPGHTVIKVFNCLVRGSWSWIACLWFWKIRPTECFYFTRRWIFNFTYLFLNFFLFGFKNYSHCKPWAAESIRLQPDLITPGYIQSFLTDKLSCIYCPFPWKPSPAIFSLFHHSKCI